VFSNTAPIAANSVLADIVQIGSGGGYTSGPGGGIALTPTLSAASGTAKLTIPDVVFTATGAAVGPFQFVALYNDSAITPTDALVCWAVVPAAVTLADGEAFTIHFDAVNGLWQLS
jgi:hypothetical protein